MGSVEELIRRRRHQVLVHSILYYRHGESTLSDATFDAWARELAQLQRDNPDISASVEYQREAFADFAGETGYHLPLMDERANAAALDVLRFYKDQEKD